jgi:hypothetical protein
MRTLLVLALALTGTGTALPVVDDNGGSEARALRRGESKRSTASVTPTAAATGAYYCLALFNAPCLCVLLSQLSSR